MLSALFVVTGWLIRRPQTQSPIMNILLRKFKGRFVPMFGSKESRSFGTGAPAGAVTAFLSSGLMIALVAIAFIVAAAFAGLFHPPSHALALSPAHLGFAPLVGSLTVKSLTEKRAKLAADANEILTAAGKENRDLSDEDNQKFDAIHADIERVNKDIERVEKQERLNKQLGESRGVVAGKQDTERPEQVRTEVEERSAAYAEAFETYVRYGKEELEPEQRKLLRTGFRKVEGASVNAGDAEQRAQTVTTTGGGYLIPQGFQAELEANMKLFGGVEDACRIIETPTGNPLPWPTRDDTGNTGRLLTINTQATTTDLTYGVKTLNAYKFSSDAVLIPVELLQDSAIDINSEVGSALGERLGRVHNTYETTGTGSSQPQGIVVGSSNGVTAAGTTSVTVDEILDLVHSVDPAYRKPIFGAGFMFNDSTFKILRKLKDGEGRPLWQAGIAGGAPNTLYDFPYTINQDMASMTTGLKPILFGALKKFIVRKVKGFTLLRLEERYADYHQVGFLAFTRMDSIMLDSGAQDPAKYITMA